MDAFLFFLEADDGMGGFLVNPWSWRHPCRRCGVVLNDGHLHAQANARNGIPLVRAYSTVWIFLNAAVSKAARHQNAVHGANHGLRALFLNFFRVYPENFHAGVIFRTGVSEGFIDGFVGVLESDVFTYYGNPDGVAGLMTLPT